MSYWHYRFVLGLFFFSDTRDRREWRFNWSYVKNLHRTMTTTLVHQHDGRSQIDILTLDMAGVCSRPPVRQVLRHPVSIADRHAMRPLPTDQVTRGSFLYLAARATSYPGATRSARMEKRMGTCCHGRREGDARRHGGEKMWCCLEAPPHFESESETESNSVLCCGNGAFIAK